MTPNATLAAAPLTHQLHAYLAAGQLHEARAWLLAQAPADRADLLADVAPRALVSLFRSLPAPIATETFSYASAALQHQLLASLGEADLAELLAHLEGVRELS